MKSGIKIFVVSMTAILLIFLIGIAVLLNRLPSAGQLKKTLASKDTPAAQPTSEQALPQAVDSSPAGPGTPGASESGEEKIIHKDTKDINKSIEPYIFGNRVELVDVCAHLGDAAQSQVKLGKGADTFFASIGEAIESGKTDPFAEAIFAPIRYAVRMPKAQEFFDAIRTAEENGEQNLMDKAGFYAKGLAAYQEIQANNKKINDVANNAHQLFLISEAIRQNPQLASNPEVNSYCQELEDKVRSGREYDFDKDPQEMLKFLEYAHVRPEDVKYDPQARPNMNVEFTRHSFTIGFGWLGDYMGQPQNGDQKN